MDTSILDKLDLLGEQHGAATGTFLPCRGEVLRSFSPIDGRELGRVRTAGRRETEEVLGRAEEAYRVWRSVPAPRRGDIVRQIGNALRAHKADLGALITLEMGKIRAEGEGEVQEMIDMADFAVGQSRMLYGLSMHSERPGHRLYEQWHPLGPVAVVTSFNFPVAVWAWNAMLALVAGDVVIWKPSSKTPLCAIAVAKIAGRVLRDNGLGEGLLNLLVGGREEVGETLIGDPRVPLVSATGSTAMGRHVGQVVARRLGRSLLELGGNNAVIVSPGADLDLACQAILFGALGTAGQRCTSIRRVIAHEGVFEQLAERLTEAYRAARVGNPLAPETLMGPLVDRDAVAAMQRALSRLKAEGGRVHTGGEVLAGGLFAAGTYVRPCLCESAPGLPLLKEETFAPILHLLSYREAEEAIAIQNDVPQGLASAIFTNDLREAELFLSARGSDCGIANVNAGTSGAEIGGAFGGEKDSGGGREAGSDAWKAYMRRQTCTINWSAQLPLSQGLRFEPR
jgi:aldehyde dehydrogenase (NAD+)